MVKELGIRVLGNRGVMAAGTGVSCRGRCQAPCWRELRERCGSPGGCGLPRRYGLGRREKGYGLVREGWAGEVGRPG